MRTKYLCIKECCTLTALLMIDRRYLEGRVYEFDYVPDKKHFRNVEEMKILDLPLISAWYLMLESGVKKEEYREIKPYWVKRLCYINGKCDWGGYCQMSFVCKKVKTEYTHIRFRYGYTKRTMLFKLDNISIGKGNPEWGAPEHEVFILKLGERINE